MLIKPPKTKPDSREIRDMHRKSHPTEPTVFVVAPTYREPRHLKEFLSSWDHVAYEHCIIVVVNANPGDESSNLLLEKDFRHRTVEIPSNPSVFWTGLVESGLRWVLSRGRDDDIVVVTNIDTSFDSDVLFQYLNIPNSERSDAQIGAVIQNSVGGYVSAGVQVESWIIAKNKHVYSVPRNAFRTVSYLPMRMVFMPVMAVRAGGFPNSHSLPHYGADYEFSNRIRRSGYEPKVCGELIVRTDLKNTGIRSDKKISRLTHRLRGINSLKSTMNPLRRFHFVRLAYPKGARIPGMLANFVKITIEIFFGINYWSR
jgi:GT2 family glycosyltransferase